MKCLCKCIQSNRGFGTWPTPEFKELDEEEKVKFYKNIQGLNGTQVKLFASQFLEKHCKNETYWAEGGEFYSLSVWTGKVSTPPTSSPRAVMMTRLPIPFFAFATECGS